MRLSNGLHLKKASLRGESYKLRLSLYKLRLNMYELRLSLYVLRLRTKFGAKERMIHSEADRDKNRGKSYFPNK